MGYANNGQLGDITSLLRSRGFNVPTTATTPAAPVAVPVRIAPVTPITSLPMAQAIQNILKPAAAPLTSPTTVQTVQKLAPVVAPVMGPAGALLAPLTEAMQQPPTLKVRIMAPPVSLAPSETPAPAAAPATSSGTVYNADGSPANSSAVDQADVTGGASDLLASIKKLPPVALAAVAVGAFVLFNRR